MKDKLNLLLNKLPFNGYKAILGTVLTVFIVPIVPASITVFGGAIAAKAIVTGLAAFLAGSGIAHKAVK